MKPKMQLFLIPFAGGNCYSYNFLEKGLALEFEIHALELPGRGKQVGSKFLNTGEEALNDYLVQIKKRRSKAPFMIYGHSMGSLLGLAVTEQLERAGDNPVALIVSGNPGPRIGLNRNVHLFNNEDFKNEMRDLGGVPEEILTDEELFNFFVPPIRSDYKILETGGPWLNAIVNCPIHVVLGDEEEYADQQEGWKKSTRDEFTFSLLPGGHFFIFENHFEIIELLKKVKDEHLVH